MPDTLQAVVEGHNVTYNLSPTSNGKVTSVVVNDILDADDKPATITIQGGAYPPEVPGIIQRDLAQMSSRPSGDMSETTADDIPTDAGTPTTEADKNDPREVFPKVADGATLQGAQGNDTVAGQLGHELPQDESAQAAARAGDGRA